MRAYFDRSVYWVFASTLFVGILLFIYRCNRKEIVVINCMVPDKVFSGDMVKFNDQTVGAATWVWDFGDSTGKSHIQNPSHFYHEEGTYDVSLTVNNEVTEVKQIIVEPKIINPRTVTPEADWHPYHPKTGEAIRFTDSTPGAIAWEWNFGENNSTSKKKDPIFAYNDYGTKKINLKVIGKDFTGETTYTIEVLENSEIKPQAIQQIKSSGSSVTKNNNPVKPEKKYSFRVHNSLLDRHELYPIKVEGDNEFGGHVTVSGKVNLELSTDRKKIFAVVNASFNESKGKHPTKANIDGSLPANKILLFTAPVNKTIVSLPQTFSQKFDWSPPPNFHDEKHFFYKDIFVSKISLIGDTEDDDLPSDGTRDNCRFRIYFDDFDIILSDD